MDPNQIPSAGSVPGAGAGPIYGGGYGGGFNPPPSPPGPGNNVPPIQNPPPSGGRPNAGGGNRRTPIIAAVGGLLAVVLIVAAFFGVRYIQGNSRYNSSVEDGQTALDSGDLSMAEESFKAALDEKPDSSEAQSGLETSVLSQAENYLKQEKFDEARQVLSELEDNCSDANSARYTTLSSIASTNPSIDQVDVNSFPVISVTMSCGSEGLTADKVKVNENGTDRALRDFKAENNKVTITYETDDAGYNSEQRNLSVTLNEEEFSFQRTSSYNTPQFQQANVHLVTTDVSAYPVVKAYFSVEDPASGSVIQGLNQTSFRIQERLQGGEYLAREIRSVSPMESLGLNIDLVADKSSSIEYDDMNRIKSVMTDFVNHLRFDVGDKAEIIAFDDIVQQMCYFTNNASLLINGINNMSTDGRTAFYDAVYSGIRNASLQGGARCVIAFTDGMDNESYHSYSDVINYANTNQVPVYIIGVGDYVEESILQNIAVSTGGRYWFISDLYDLQEIYDEIYAEQKDLYMIEYVSDSAVDQYSSRDLTASVSGGGYRGDTTATFTPAHSVQNLTHTSRYELVPGTYTWEEANQRCQEMGGHLVTITSQQEMDQIIALAEQNDCKYVWLGGYTSYNFDGSVFGHWVTGEDFSFQAWGDGQPTRTDMDGTPEWYIMLWYVHDQWRWNDQRNDPASASKPLNEHSCFICEYES